MLLDRRDLRALVDDDRLVHVVVRPAEIDDLRAGGRVGDLVDVEVERLRPGRVGTVERHVGPRHLALRVAELRRDRVGDGGLVALARRGIVDLPLRALRAARIPRRVGRIVGADRELAARRPWGSSRRQPRRGSGCAAADAPTATAASAATAARSGMSLVIWSGGLSVSVRGSRCARGRQAYRRRALSARSAGRSAELRLGGVREDLSPGDRVEVVEGRANVGLGGFDLLVPFGELEARVERASRQGGAEAEDAQEPRTDDPPDDERRSTARGDRQGEGLLRCRGRVRGPARSRSHSTSCLRGGRSRGPLGWHEADYSIGISKRAMMPGSPPRASSSGSGSRVATQAYPSSG